MELWPKLLRRLEEENIVSLVSLSREFLDSELKKTIGDTNLEEYLNLRGWSNSDLDLSLARPEALRLFALYHFGPSLEENFLASHGSYDQVIYSILRVRDASLAQELWIRLEENEASFAELASIFGEGEESAHKGIIGPRPMGSIQPPQLAGLLRTLQPGEIYPPHDFGGWHVLLRLEQIKPARFDRNMKDFLLNKQLDEFLDKRVISILNGESVPSLTYQS